MGLHVEIMVKGAVAIEQTTDTDVEDVNPYTPVPVVDSAPRTQTGIISEIVYN